MARGALAQGLPVLATETDVYQPSIGFVKTFIQNAKFVNTGATPVTLQVWITPDDTTVTSDELKVITDHQIGVGETYLASELMGTHIISQGKVIAQGDVAGLSAWLDGNEQKTEF